MESRLENDTRSGKGVGRRVELAILAGILPVLTCFIVFTYGGQQAEPDNTSAPGPALATSSQDYSRFRHDVAQHKRMPCLVCHVRNDNSAAVKYPGHIPCASCHVQQFADSNHPICTICHTTTSVKRFPPLRSFNAVFDHAKHLSQTNCATCHKPAARGVALSIPSRLNAHTTCFQCHGPRTVVGGRNIGSCSICHQPGRPTRTSLSAKAFSENFNHAEHVRKNLGCSECHTVRAAMPRGRQVSSPLASMHFAPAGRKSCAACHNNRRAFGGNDFSDCKKCHEGRTFRF